ncbi:MULTISPECIES: hypothetical protein [Streptomyces]|uniref:Uncharacterized protein n=1 Tax=Streptomyces chilikensis TaxID=1194079 RepID=A0ABV3EUI8_9ACTN|nr:MULTISPECIES: hypothetical protein [Streptomyces]MDH6229415.1 putative transcriptional regulator [Streptomyces sp. MJP52]
MPLPAPIQQELSVGTFNVFAYMPAMPGIAYRVLFELLGTQQNGGLCLVTEEALAAQLGVHRSMAGRGLQSLIHARMVFREARGTYRLNPMLAGGRTFEEHLEAIRDLAPEDRLDVDHFQDRYDRAVAEASIARQRRNKGRTKASSAPDTARREKAVAEADVVSITAARRRPRRQPS